MAYFLLAFFAFTIIVLMLSPLFGRRLARAPKILVLHSLKRRPFDFSSISLRQFERLIEVVHSLGLTFSTIEEAHTDHTKVALTFDDGYDDLLEIKPIIANRSLPVTVFVSTAFIGRSNTWDNFFNSGKRNHLDESQIHDLSSIGVTFGSHGHTHRDLTHLNKQELRAELMNSKEILERVTGKEITSVAFPFGRTDSRICRIAEEVGYKTLLLSTPKVNGSRMSSSCFGRIPTGSLDSPLSISAKLKPHPLSGTEFLKIHIISRFAQLTSISRKAALKTKS